MKTSTFFIRINAPCPLAMALLMAISSSAAAPDDASGHSVTQHIGLDHREAFGGAVFQMLVHFLTIGPLEEQPAGAWSIARTSWAW